MAEPVILHTARKSHISLQMVSKYKYIHIGTIIHTTVGTTANTIILAYTFLQLMYRIWPCAAFLSQHAAFSMSHKCRIGLCMQCVPRETFCLCYCACTTDSNLSLPLYWQQLMNGSVKWDFYHAVQTKYSVNKSKRMQLNSKTLMTIYRHLFWALDLLTCSQIILEMWWNTNTSFQQVKLCHKQLAGTLKQYGLGF